MTENRANLVASTMRHVAGAAILLTGVLAAACSPNAGSGAASKLRTYAADLSGGAKVCDAPEVKPTAGQVNEVAIKLVNDGGWCGLRTRQDGSKPFDAGLLTARAAHGSVTIHEVGDETRIDYAPDPKYTGADSFAVKLIPGSAVLHVAVTVAAPL